MMIVKNTKRSTPSIYQKKKKLVKGIVDRVSNGIVVIITKDPQNSDYIKEVYVPVSKFSKRVPEEGEYVSIMIEV